MVEGDAPRCRPALDDGAAPAASEGSKRVPVESGGIGAEQAGLPRPAVRVRKTEPASLAASMIAYPVGERVSSGLGAVPRPARSARKAMARGRNSSVERSNSTKVGRFAELHKRLLNGTEAA